MRIARDGIGMIVAMSVLFALNACNRSDDVGAKMVGSQYAPYHDPPTVRSFPASAAIVNGWVAAADTVSVRQHGWDMWESITSAVAKSSEPVWETWYSGHEIFEVDTTDAIQALARAGGRLASAEIPRSATRIRFELPRQSGHHLPRAIAGIPIERAGSVFSFNRYSQSTARYIYFQRLWNWSTMRALNDGFNKQNAPVATRLVRVSTDTTDSLSVVLKPVFQFIDGFKPSCIPYWAGDTPQVTDSAGKNPVATQWKQYVIVDPKRELKQKAVRGTTFTNCPISDISWPVVTLDRFYYRRVDSSMAKSFSSFAEGSGDDLGKLDSATASAIAAMIKVGNIGLLVAMHVTGKEISNWTWQSFWWSPTPNDSLGFDRPATIGAPWNNYEMTTAYWMTAPPSATTKGVPRIAYNPYLETSLTGTVDTNGVQGARWYGPTTNCMSCHRMASWKDTVVFDSTTQQLKYAVTGPPGPYVPASYVDPSNATLFSGLTKTDFLWSVAIRTHGIPAYVPPKK